MRIDGTTRITGVFGYPISHTRSPAMHNFAYSRLDLNIIYVPFLVNPRNLGAAIKGVRALGVAGVNVTLPHKQAVMKHLDTVSPESRLIGAVNTVVNRGGKLFGTTTDPYGIVMALKRKKIAIKNKRVTLLGTGGTARTALFTFLFNGCKDIVLAGRRPRRGLVMARDAGGHFKRKIPVLSLYGKAFDARMRETDLLVNCTSVGMSGASNEMPVRKEHLRPGLAVFDIVYNRKQATRLVREAEKKGLATACGMDMLIYQGIAAFKLFTGKTVSYDLFRKGFLS